MRGRALWAVAVATFREFWRTREAVFWSYGFPLAMAVVLGFAFGSEHRQPLRVGVVDAPAAWTAALAADGRIRTVVVPADQAQAQLARGRLDAVLRAVDGDAQIVLDPSRPESELVERLVDDRLQRAAGRRDLLAFLRREVTEPGARYIDFLIAGLVALNLLGMGMFGVGFNLVNMRVEKLLRRLLVTPMSKAEFMVGFLASRFVLALPAALTIVFFGMLVFGVPMRGSWLAVLAILVVGGAALSGLGVLVASRVQTLEGAGGLMNLVQLPLWLMGGVFFSNERFPALVQPFIRLLPTTQIADSLRAVMLEGHGLGHVIGSLGLLALFALVTTAVGIRVFRWA